MTTSAQVCSCGAPAARDAYLCDHCTGRLRSELRRLAPIPDAHPGHTRWDTERGFAGLGSELDTLLARQARLGASDSRGGEKPVPFHERAAEVRGTLLLHLHPWAAWLAGTLPPIHHRDGTVDQQQTTTRDRALRTTLDRAGPGGLAAFLLDHVETIRMTDGAAELAAAVFDAVTVAERIIDRPAELWFAGICGHELPDDTTCPVPLYARATDAVVPADAGERVTAALPDPDDVIVCRDHGPWTGCGTEWRVVERRAWLRAAAVDELGTAATVANALSRLGREVNPRRLRVWRHRGVLLDRGAPCAQHRVPQWVETGRHVDCPSCGPALYRVGDVMDLLDRADAVAEARLLRRSAASA